MIQEDVELGKNVFSDHFISYCTEYLSTLRQERQKRLFLFADNQIVCRNFQGTHK